MAKPRMKLSARVYDDNGNSFLASVPVIMTTIPEVPKVIVIGKLMGFLTSTNPVTYHATTAVTATKLRRNNG